MVEKLESAKNFLVGIKDGKIIYLEYVFWYSEGFKGAIGIGLEYKTESEAEYLWEDARENPTDYIDRDLWEDAVCADRTDDSYEDFADQAIKGQEDEYLSWPNADGSYTGFVSENEEKWIRDYLGETEPLVYSWTGSGRMFNKDYELDVVANPEVLEIIKEFESEKDMSEERARELIAKINSMKGE